MITRDDLYALCLAIEKLPASERQTQVSVMASDLLRRFAPSASEATGGLAEKILAYFDGKKIGPEEVALIVAANAATRSAIEAPEGEYRWLIERTCTSLLNDYDWEPTEIPPERQFWSGAGWSTSALYGARYPTKAAAEATVSETFTTPNTIEVCEHLFQCGIATRPEIGSQDAKDAARYRWLLHRQSFGKADSKSETWLHLKGYHINAEPLNGGWLVKKEHVDSYIDAAIRAEGGST